MAKKKLHPADAAAIEDINNAVSFNVHLRRSPTSKINEPAATLDEAVSIADRIKAEYPSRNVLIYAITADQRTVPVPTDMQTAARKGDFEETPTNRPVKARPVSKRAQIEADARAGKLPPPPDFSAPTHKPYRKRLSEVVAMAEAGDLERLKALDIKTYSSSPKAIDRYRNLAVVALEAQQGA